MIRNLLSVTFLHARRMGRFFYAVGSGRQTGVFPTWDECKLQVAGFSGARYKKFGTEEEAWDFVNAAKACASGSAPKPVTSSKRATSSRYKQPSSTVPHGLKRLYSTDSVDPSPPKRRRTAPAQAPSPSGGDRRSSACDLVVYTDGACSGNGYHGAKAGLGVFWGPSHPLNLSARLEGKQTNQRAELTAALRALEQVSEHYRRRKVILYTDSKYTINCVTDWIHRWKRNGWKTSGKTDVINKEDLVKLDKLNTELDIRWEYVPGHQNVYGNEEADKLAREGAAQPLPGNQR